jgi:hypothetical protein
MEPAPGAAAPAALAALEVVLGRAAAIRLPPADLPGWSSLCASEYRDQVAGLAAELSALRAALDAAVRAAAGP